METHTQDPEKFDALIIGAGQAAMKAVVDADSGLILGGAVLGLEGGELMAMLQLAMMGELPYTRLRDAIFAHPTLAESLNSLFASPQPADGQPD
jgi:pyruvate/2-oxoglutarate dehydrogenase complex dihydrolipoamide dehydrogenase (E3) component